MASQRNVSLCSIELGNLIFDLPNARFNPVVPQSEQEPSNNPRLAQTLVHRRAIPKWTQQLILAAKAFKQYGGERSYQMMKRFAYKFGPFESKIEFAYAFASEAVPNQHRSQGYRNLGIKEVRKAIAGMQGDGEVPQEWWQAVEESLN